jgi:hypothetical protein
VRQLLQTDNKTAALNSSKHSLQKKEKNRQRTYNVTVRRVRETTVAVGGWAGIAQSVQRLATGWTVRGSNPGGGLDIPHPSRPGLGPTQPPIEWSFPGVKRPGRCVDHPPPSSAEVKVRVELYLYSPSGPSWPLLGRTFTFTVAVGTGSLSRGKNGRGVALTRPHLAPWLKKE